jgi:hypothetical protein
MGAIGAVFQPELIELMKAVLDDATAMLPEAKRTSTALKIGALSAVVECTHYSHDISPERRAV